MLSLTSTLFLPLLRSGDWTPAERVAVVVRPLIGLLLVLVIYGYVRRNPWPRPFRVSFALRHAGVAALLITAWILLSQGLESLLLAGGSAVPHEEEFAFIGCLAYAIVTGLSYAVESTARAARAEAAAARTQLAALRAQLHPHFLFNALHTVVQLIPVNPALAMDAAELVADLLRCSLEEEREEVPLADEWRFVSRYLAVERIRFGDRLMVRETFDAPALHASVPSFALQTLVENAVRHGAATRVSATALVITARVSGAALVVTVRDGGEGEPSATPTAAPSPTSTATHEFDAAVRTSGGTGLARLRERLAVLYGRAAHLECGPTPQGYEATLTIPQRQRAAA